MKILTPPMMRLPHIMLICIAAFLPGCKTTDPAQTLYQTRTNEIRDLIFRQHGQTLSRHEWDIINAEPDWFQAIPVGEVPDGRTGLDWVWLLGNEREIHANFAGRISEPVDSKRVTIRIVKVRVLGHGWKVIESIKRSP